MTPSTDIVNERSAISYGDVLSGMRSNIRRRTVSYRNLVVSVCVLILGSCVWAIGSGTARQLVFILLLVPLVAFHAYQDSRILTQWRLGVLDALSNSQIRLDYLRAAAERLPHLPPSTVSAMLNGFSGGIQRACGDAVPETVRTAVLSCAQRLDEWKRERMRVQFFALFIATASVAGAVALRAYQLIAGILLIVPIISYHYVKAGRNIARLVATLRSLLAGDQLLRNEAAALLGELDWSAVQSKVRSRLLIQLSNDWTLESTPHLLHGESG